MEINVLENGVWNLYYSNELDHITKGLYIFHFHPTRNINQQVTNVHLIEEGFDVYKFGKFTGNLHQRIYGNRIGYTRYWRYQEEEDILTNRNFESDAFEESTTRYLIHDASNINVPQIGELENFLIDNWPTDKSRFIARTEYYTLNEELNENDFLTSCINIQEAIHDFIENQQ